jgi:bifunctional DNA-binding transcriptional regulator/antitoxin component of YhaV-PrlF toxin-antitoxin module
MRSIILSKEELTPIGITRKMDALGRVVIPVEFRREMGFSIKDEIDMIMTTAGVLIRRKKKDKEK